MRKIIAGLFMASALIAVPTLAATTTSTTVTANSAAGSTSSSSIGVTPTGYSSVSTSGGAYNVSGGVAATGGNHATVFVGSGGASWSHTSGHGGVASTDPTQSGNASATVTVSHTPNTN